MDYTEIYDTFGPKVAFLTFADDLPKETVRCFTNKELLEILKASPADHPKLEAVLKILDARLASFQEICELSKDLQVHSQKNLFDHIGRLMEAQAKTSEEWMKVQWYYYHANMNRDYRQVYTEAESRATLNAIKTARHIQEKFEAGRHLGSEFGKERSRLTHDMAKDAVTYQDWELVGAIAHPHDMKLWKKSLDMRAKYAGEVKSFDLWFKLHQVYHDNHLKQKALKEALALAVHEQCCQVYDASIIEHQEIHSESLIKLLGQCVSNEITLKVAKSFGHGVPIQVANWLTSYAQTFKDWAEINQLQTNREIMKQSLDGMMTTAETFEQYFKILDRTDYGDKDPEIIELRQQVKEQLRQLGNFDLWMARLKSKNQTFDIDCFEIQEALRHCHAKEQFKQLWGLKFLATNVQHEIMRRLAA